MKVRTFHFGLAEGLHDALTRLDEEVEKLGNVTIHSVQDTLYTDVISISGRPPTEQIMTRVVIYTPK